jgi:cobalt-precorrin 5A hydrolase
MERRKALTRDLAIGVGCRARVPADAVVRAIRLALERALPDDRVGGLHTSVRKSGEAGLQAAAAQLGLTLTFHSDETLMAVEAGVVSHSDRVAALVGVGSIAEAAALLGAGVGAALLAPKLNLEGVSCAIAVATGDPD